MENKLLLHVYISGLLEFYHGLGLGHLLAKLFEEQFADVAGTQGMVAVWKAVHQLETVCASSHSQRFSSFIFVAYIVITTCGILSTHNVEQFIIRLHMI